MNTYPVFLVGLEHKRCVVLGGGSEAEQKVNGLLDCNAVVTVISRTVSPTLSQYAAQERVGWIGRDYLQGDLRGAFMVIATGRNASMNARAWAEANREGVLMNAMDDVAHCHFIAGSIVRRGPLALAISTGGIAPALAVRLRQSLERQLGEEYADLLQLLSELRPTLPDRYPDFRKRRELWYRIVDSDMLESLRRGERGRALERLRELTETGSAPVQPGVSSAVE